MFMVVMHSRLFVMRGRLWFFLGRLCRRLGFTGGANNGASVSYGDRHSLPQVRHDCEKSK